MHPLRVGILGFGFIGKVHAYAYRNLALYYSPPPLETQLAAVCTSRRETAEAARDLLDFRIATTDWREITENPEIDVVHVCTPNNLHAEQLLSAIAHNKHIYCDKPLTATAEEADQVLAAMRNYRGAHQMTFNYRFLPATLRARQWIDEGRLGEPLCFRAAYLHAGSADPRAPLTWKLSDRSGGGVIRDLGSHVLDLLRHLLGEFSEILCANQIAFPERPAAGAPATRVPVDAEDHAVMLLRTRSGALGTVEATKLATGAEDELRFEIHGTRGALRFNLMDPNWLEVYNATTPDRPLGGERGWTRVATVNRYEPPAVWPPPKVTGGWLRAHVACLHNFLEAIATGRKAEPGLEAGARIQHIMAAAHESDDTRQWVSL